MWPLEARLRHGIWHTTHPDRFVSIMAEGLKSEPTISDGVRWKTSRGPEFYPFVRKIGGVSLFDFKDFNPKAYDRSHPSSSWRAFVPHRDDWAGAIWIQIDHTVLGAHFVSTNDLVRRWEEGGHHRHTIMPRIECACIGNIPVSVFVSAFMTWSRGKEIRDLPVQRFFDLEYRTVLDEWKEALSKRQRDEVTIR